MAVALLADCMLDTLSSVMCDGRKLCVNTVGFSRVVLVGLLKDRFRMIYDCMTLRYLWERKLFSRVFLFARWPFLSRADSPFHHRSRFVRSFVLKLHPPIALSIALSPLALCPRPTHDFFSARSKLCPLLMNRVVSVPKLSDFITTWAVGQGETVDSLKLSRERLSGA